MAKNTTGLSGDDVGELEDRVLVGRYRIAKVVSAGANTIIADAYDIESDRPVTFKIARPHLASSEAFRRDFRRTAELAMALNHPNIAMVLDWGELDIDGDSTVFWVVEYLAGGSLRDLFDRGRLLEPSQALVVGLEACRALDAAHQRGVVHTELTPSKLVFGDDRRLRIIDFGMAELLGREAWSEPATVATHVARYASPEQALGLGVSPKTDVYALALSLLEAVTGAVPFAADSTVSTLAARVGKLMPVSADLGSLAAVLERAGRPEPDDRFTAAEFGRALVQAAERLPRPEPIPIVAASLFDTSGMQRPGAARPAVPPAPPAGAGDLAAVDAPGAGADGSDGDSETVAGPEANGLVILTDVASDSPAPEPAAPEPAAPGPAAPEPAAPVADPTVPPPPGPAPAAPTAPAPTAPDPTPLGPMAPAPTAPAPVAPAPVGPELAAPEPAAPTVPVPPVSLAAPAAPAATPVAAPTERLPLVAPAASGGGELYDDERPRRRTAAVVALASFVLIGLAAIAFAGFWLLRTKTYEVPDLTGVDEAVALNEISGNGWEIVIERERSDEQPVVDTVIRTFPAAGAVLDEGAEFRMFVSEGPLFRVLPAVDGLTLEAAQAQLEALQLSSFVDGDVFDEVVPTGTVVSWVVRGDASKVAGDEVLPGTNIALTVSKGPAPRIVPDVVGSTLADASAAAAAVQLNVVPGEEAFSDDVPIGVVISQSVAAGSELDRDGSFEVIVSKGPDLIALPALEGLTFTEAQTALTDAGFTIGSLLGTTEGVFQSISISAEPIDGLYRRGTSVDLIFL